MEDILYKVTTAGSRLNDKDRMPITDCNDKRLLDLSNVVTSLKLMDNSVSGKRCKGITSETSDAWHVTITGIVNLIKVLLQLDHLYVLPGKIQGDRIEAEFGIYRQSSGGNFFYFCSRGNKYFEFATTKIIC